MKKLITLSSFIAMALLFACNNSKESEAEKPATIPESSEKVMVVRFPVTDYSKFHEIYNSKDSMRGAFGISKYFLAREMEDSNKVIVLEQFTDLQKAKDFAANPELKPAMEQGTVSGPATFDYVNMVRNDDSKIDSYDRVLVKHRVKDFAAWLERFDKEGLEARKASGLLDRGLSRGAEDSNMVYVVFAITDMEKAKARMQSPDLKKIMEEAGVEGVPEIVMYRIEH